MSVSGPWVKGVWGWMYESVWARGWKDLGDGCVLTLGVMGVMG